MMKLYGIGILLTSLLSSFFCFAAEVDNFSVANLPVFDATSLTNHIINNYLATLSKKTKGCDREQIIQNARYLMDTNFPNINSELKHNIQEQLFIRNEMPRDSKFRKLSFEKNNEAARSNHNPSVTSADPTTPHQDPPVVEGLDNTSNVPTTVYENFMTPGYSSCCSPVLEVAGAKVGIDKIDHFLSSGFFMFIEHSKQNQINPSGEIYFPMPLHNERSEEDRKKDALKFNTFSEEASWGLAGTGVKSYGDMAANYQGYKFYKELIDGDNPYIKCVDNKWIKNREFKIQDYADDSWDESINCSSYNSAENRDVILANIKKIGFEECPISKEKCAALTKKHGEDGKNYLHPKCLDPASKHTQVENARSGLGMLFKFIDLRDVIRGVKGAK